MYVFGPSPDREEFFAVVSNYEQDGSAGGVAPPEGSKPDGRASLSERADAPLLEERFRGFTLLSVIIAGLLDGINPCAIFTLVFL